MYTRNYQSEENDTLKIPEGYDGIAFRENEAPVEKEATEEAPYTSALRAPWDEIKEVPPAAEPVMARPKQSDSFLTGLLGRFNVGGLLDKCGLLRDGRINFGSEEILLIGVALLLLFNKSGDKECAVMLLLLLFVG